MAEVVVARRNLEHDATPVAEKLVALKRLKPELADDDSYRQMLVAEARLGAGFNHPNLVEAYDLGEHEGHYFFTMELVRGHELRHLVRAAGAAGGRVPMEHVLAIVAAIAAGLDYSHDLRAASGQPLNIVHLDVCPSNVLVGPDGFVKLIDFGIARHDLPGGYATSALSPSMPARRGTIAYMSPEQCMQFALDRRSDVFSLGVILWELTVWARLYRAASTDEVRSKIVEHDAPRPRSLRPDYPAELEAIVMQALARNPAERFANARALLVALEEFAHAHGVGPSTTRLGSFVRELMPTPAGTEIPRETSESSCAPVTVGEVKTAPYPIAPLSAATDFARRFQPISRRWRD